MAELKERFTIVIVTHNMQQAARVSESTGFFNLNGVGQPGRLIEFNPTEKIFSNPDQKATEDRSEEHTSELQSRQYLVCRLLLEKKKKKTISQASIERKQKDTTRYAQIKAK